MNKWSFMTPKVALNINIWQDSEERVFFTHDREIKSAIMPRRYLPTLVRIINGLHSPLLQGNGGALWPVPSVCNLPIDFIELDFTKSQEAGSPYYKNNVVANNPVNFLGGLRQSKRSPLRIGISGLDAEGEDRLLKASYLSAWGAKGFVTETKDLIQRAETLQEQKRYDAAYSQLRIAETMLGFTIKSQGIIARNTNRVLAFEATAAMLHLLLLLNRVAKHLSSPELISALLGS